MKNITKILLFIYLSLLSANKITVEITFENISQLDELVQIGIDLDHYRTANKVHAFVSQSEFNIINNMNFGIKEIPNEAHIYFQQLKNETRNSNNPMDDYHNYNELTSFLQNIASNYPDITQLATIGQSVEGRELWVMEISENPGVNEIEPEFKYIANMHGDETVGRELSLYLIEWLVEGYNSNQRATDLINNTSIFIMPTMNPDGFENGSRYNSNGVDLNRDFPDQFNDPNNTLSNREPETQAVMEWSWNHNFVLSANMHTGALVANYPFDGPNSGVYSPCADDDLFIDLALTYANAHPNMESGGFSNGITNGAEWYAVFGGMQDWNYVWEENFEITLEQNNVKWPNASQLPGLWDDHREPMIAYIEAVHTGLRGIITNQDNLPLNATIIVEGNSHTINNDPEHGDYYRLLKPGQYNITFQSFGYLSQNLLVTIPNEGYFQLNIQLEPDPWLDQAEIENFESGAFSNLDWTLDGNVIWQIDNNEFFEGNFSSRSGEIDHDEESMISITLDIIEDGNISFYKKTSCESVGSSTGNYYDYLAFLINDEEIEKWAGEIDWSLETFPVNAGTHTFSWKFVKDYAVTSGQDAVWLDFIVFPPIYSNDCPNNDINNDCTTNVLDVIFLVNFVLNNEQANDEEFNSADINQDGVLNVIDIVLMVNLILQ